MQHLRGTRNTSNHSTRSKTVIKRTYLVMSGRVQKCSNVATCSSYTLTHIHIWTFKSHLKCNRKLAATRTISESQWGGPTRTIHELWTEASTEPFTRPKILPRARRKKNIYIIRGMPKKRYTNFAVLLVSQKWAKRWKERQKNTSSCLSSMALLVRRRQVCKKKSAQNLCMCHRWRYTEGRAGE